jgi:hypothetical protein
MHDFSLAVRNLRDPAPIIVSPAPLPGPRVCCSDFAHVVECTEQASIWRCPVCRRLWSVAHQKDGRGTR